MKRRTGTGTESKTPCRSLGLGPSGERFDGEALRLYEVRDGKFARAQMFYFDGIAVQRFLAAAQAEATPCGSQILDRRERTD